MNSTVISQINEICHKCHSHLITPNQATEAAGTIAAHAIQKISEGKHEAQTKLKAIHSSMKSYFELNAELFASLENFLETQEEEAYNNLQEVIGKTQDQYKDLKSKYRL